MRVLLGLALLAAGVNAQTTVTVIQTLSPLPAGAVQTTQFGALASAPITGSAPLAQVRVFNTAFTSTTGAGPTFTSGSLQPWGFISGSGSFFVSVPNTVSALVFEFQTNQYVGQAGYRWNPNYSLTNALNAGTISASFGFSGATYLCDPCTLAANTWVGDVMMCSQNGPNGKLPSGATSSSTGFQCANLHRLYTLSGLQDQSVGPNGFGFSMWDVSQTANTLQYAYVFSITRLAATKVVGDPQIVGMQGQDFQVHGIPDEVFNMVSYPTLQINARFSYLESADCLDNYTACFAHPGTYISEEGFRIGKDKVRVTAGSHKKGLTVSVNGKKVNRNTDLKLGAIEVVNHRRVVFHTNIMKVTVTNSDKFLNQELELNDDKLISLGAKRRHLKDTEKFHSEVPLHGLQGQTWRNVEYASGLDYEGSITDYHVVDGNLFGTDFVFNQFEA